MRKLNPSYVQAVNDIVNRCPYFSLLSMSIREIEIGQSLLHVDAQNKHLQPFGAVHGGVFASIIDAAVFWAVFPEVDEDLSMTTVDLKVHYLAPAQGGKLIAKGRRIKVGKTLALGDAEVSNEEGKALAHGTSILMILRNPEMKIAPSLPPKFLKED
ncbi:MAG: hotdog fold thioesterase [Proteobacteria bacterium]|nr:hotdog fold thioesterase [Pseudomonadota bacterium]